MRHKLVALVLALALAGAMALPLARADDAPAAEAQNASNIVFVHTGGQSSGSAGVIAVLKALLAAGFSLRSPDTDTDIVGGPGVDYFADDDAPTAQAIANIVNAKRAPDAKKLAPRLQNASNPPHYFGVWL